MVYRKSDSLFWLIFISVLAFLFYIFKTNNSDKAYEPAMGVVVYSIFAFGYLIKFMLSLFFPEVILSEKGIKFIGRKYIGWDDIKKIKIAYNNNSKIEFLIIKNNSKMIKEDLNLSYFGELQFFVRSFSKKYRTRKI